MSTEESRPILNGVLWELKPEAMRMVATNGHRLAKMEVPIKSSGAPAADLIVPPKALEQIRRLFPADEELEIARGDNHLGFRSPFTAVFTRLIMVASSPSPNPSSPGPLRHVESSNAGAVHSGPGCIPKSK